MANSSSGSQRLSPWQHNLLPALVTASSCEHTWPPRLKLDGAHRPVAGLGTRQGSTAQSTQAGDEPEPREGACRGTNLTAGSGTAVRPGEPAAEPAHGARSDGGGHPRTTVVWGPRGWEGVPESWENPSLHPHLLPQPLTGQEAYTGPTLCWALQDTPKS